MAENKKISELTRVSSLTGAEIVPFAKDGSNGAVTTAKLKEYAQPDLSAITTALGGKVDKVTGKGLSTNDYTDEDKAKLTALPTSTQLTEKIDEAKLALFVDQFNAAAGDNGKYDPANAPDPQHPFYLNTLWLTYKEAMAVMHAKWGIFNDRVQCPLTIRTNMPNSYIYTHYADVNDYVDMASMFSTTKLKVLRLWPDNFYVDVENISGAFFHSEALESIFGIIDLGKLTEPSKAGNAFVACKALKEVSIRRLKVNLSLSDSPLLSLSTMQYMVSNAANTSPITVTVHPEVYAKLTATEHSAQARSNLALNSDVPVTSANYPMKQYPLNTVVKTGDALTITVWGTPSEGSYFYAVIENCRVEGNLVEISPGVWQKTFVLKGEKATAPHLNIYNNPNNRLEGHIDKVKICYGLDPNPQWSAPVEMPTDPEAIEAIGWERVMLMAAAKQINFATT